MPENTPNNAPARRTFELRTCTFVEPALPKLVTMPPAGADWLHEIKFDGWRTQIHIHAGMSVLLSRNGSDITSRFQPLTAALAAISKSCVLDAELVALDAQGLCDFRALHRRRPDVPIVFRAFDLLRLDDVDLRPMPLTVRRMRLRRLVERAGIASLLFSEAFRDPHALLAEAERLGLEGIVSKQRSSPYLSGEACGWVKVKTRAWREASRERWRLFERT